jgi:hypothetical protein
MRKPALIAALLGAASAAPPLMAETATKVAMTCPIGGESFEHERAVSNTTFGMRPDGKPFGAGTFPAKLPECPSNGLILYKDYSPAEVEKLTAFIASDDFAALRANDTPYYRAYRLMGELGETPGDRLWVLLQAGWEADSKPELRARYLAELAEAATAVPPRPADIQWIGMEGRAINALRELGRFDEAKARLAKLDLKPLQEPLAASLEEPAGARNRRAWLIFFDKLKGAVERGDTAMEPLDMIPRSVAVERCLAQSASLDVPGQAFCSSDTVKAEVEQLAARRKTSESEAEALRRPREQSGR